MARRRRTEPKTATPVSSPTASRDRAIVAAIVAAVVQIGLIWLPVVPLGVPGEWIWHRIGFGPGEGATLFLRGLAIVPVAAVYLLICHLGDRRGAAARRAFWLAALAVAGFAWLWVVQEAAPQEIHRLGRGPIVTYYPAFSGYFLQAQQAGDFGAYLTDDESLMAEGDVLHIGTHPPGLIALHRGLLTLFRSSPALVELTLATRPSSVRESEKVLEALPLSTGPPLGKVELAELWAATLLVQAAAALAVVPLYYVTASTHGQSAAWRTACLWPLVPALAIFLPKSDALFPLIGLAVLALWHDQRAPRPLRAAAAGASFWLGMTLSLAFLPVAVIAAVLTVQMIVSAPSTERRSAVVTTLKAAAIAAAAFLALTAVVWLVCDLNLLTVWSWNYRNHAAFYDAYERTYWKWLLVNPLELSLAIGLPVIAATALSAGRHSFSAPGPLLPVMLVIGLLWLSGKNSGEAARLWLILVPWLLWGAASLWQPVGGCLRWRVVLTLQLAVSFATAVRVSGFGFLEIAGVAG